MKKMKARSLLFLTFALVLLLVASSLLGACTPGSAPQESPVTAASATSRPEIAQTAEKVTPTLTPSPEPSPNPTRRAAAYPGLPALRGVNLGNALEAPRPGDWGVAIDQSLIEAVAAAGFNAIRVPVRFSAHTGAAPDYLINETFLETVDQILTWGLEADLTVILDLHHFDALMANPAEEEDRYLAIWDQLAAHYQGLPPELYFELLNEPMDNMDATIWNGLVATSVRLIRETNPNRKIVIGGINYSDIEALQYLTLPNDPNLVAAFHYYDPFEFTHQGAPWVSGSASWVGTTWKGTSEEQQAIRQAFDRAVDWSNAHQIPLIMGEFGVIQQADAISRQTWTAEIVEAATEREIGWFYWDLCTNFGIYDCQASTWDEDLLNALIP